MKKVPANSTHGQLLGGQVYVFPRDISQEKTSPRSFEVPCLTIQIARTEINQGKKSVTFLLFLFINKDKVKRREGQNSD